jgi:hypothetical protein
MKQTGTEYLIEQVKSKEWQDMWIWHKEEIFEKAKEIEKLHIKIGFVDGYDSKISSDQYFNKTFNEDKDS